MSPKSKSTPSKKKRATTSTKKRKTTKRLKPSKLKRIFFNRYSLISIIILGLVFSIYLVYLDQLILNKMSGRIWSLPSHIYARPLELYEGKILTTDELQSELNNTGYQQVTERPAHPGQYRVLNQYHYELISKDFKFWDGLQKSQGIRLTIANNEINAIHELYSNKSVPLFRLQPELIAGIYPQQKEERTIIQLKHVPDDLVLALLAVEDKRFYDHWGIDLRSIARAMVTNLLAGKTVQGGSTITQQLVKNLFLTPERTLVRKINEALMAILLEIRYDKSDILEAYINEVYLGQSGVKQIHGFELASQFYFAKSLRKIRRDQMALLVGIVKGPSWYDPRRQPQRAKDRRNQVLQLMSEQGVLTSTQLVKYKAQSLGIAAKPSYNANKYPALVDLVKRHLIKDYKEEDLKSSGLRIFTSIDSVKQQKAEQTVKRVLPGLERQNNPESPLQVSVILASSHQGEIEAMVSDRNPAFAGFNRSIDAVRQIGSMIKPAIYLTALNQPDKYSFSSLLDDSPLHIQSSKDKIWSPLNYDKEYQGDITLFRALRDSRNIPTVRLGLELGLADIADTINRLGVDKKIPSYPSMTLGAFDLSPMDIANMYQTYAANGFHVPLKVIREVLDKDGNPVKRYPLDTTKTLDDRPLFLTNYIMHQVTESGTAKSVSNHFNMPLAGKTGTTDNLRDSWFAGFSDNQLAVVWVGRDDNTSTGLTGASGALPVWIDLMKQLPLSPLSLTTPSGVDKVWVDKESGGLSDKSCQGAVEWPFISGSAPTEKVECKSGLLYQIRRFFN